MIYVCMWLSKLLLPHILGCGAGSINVTGVISCQCMGSVQTQHLDKFWYLLVCSPGKDTQKWLRLSTCKPYVIVNWLFDLPLLSPYKWKWDKQSVGRPWPSVGRITKEFIIIIIIIILCEHPIYENVEVIAYFVTMLW